VTWTPEAEATLIRIVSGSTQEYLGHPQTNASILVSQVLPRKTDAVDRGPHSSAIDPQPGFGKKLFGIGQTAAGSTYGFKSDNKTLSMVVFSFIFPECRRGRQT